MREAQVRAGNARILYDADAVAYALHDWFEPKSLAARGWLIGSVGGRGCGHVHFFGYRGNGYALRHYRRGGKAATVIGDHYLWAGLDRTRAWREWRLLARLTELNLPVPHPFAARVIKSGLFYRADLITMRIASSSSLFERLMIGALPDAIWREIGRVIAEFHRVGVWHADLNAHNVLLSSDAAVAIVDFDRARFRRNTMRWREANLARLLRSLRKLKSLKPELPFHESDFELLREGYCSRRL
jgi:3-deoxy-D-manno-octulosonic acid kinase